MILTCKNPDKCQHSFQDKEHGYKKRVHNQIVTPPNTPKKYRCTVCLNEREVSN